MYKVQVKRLSAFNWQALAYTTSIENWEVGAAGLTKGEAVARLRQCFRERNQRVRLEVIR